MDFQPVRGTRDFYPDQMRLRNWLFDIWQEAALQFGFEEYDSCVIEHEELYLRKAGEEITAQLYTFEDKSGRKLALRPEMTPSLARMILQHKKSLSLPVKWFAIPQCFRYERMTRGRKREHFQWNVDIIGQETELAEAEIISMLILACQKMGLTAENIRVFLNDRHVLNAILDHLGVEKEKHLPAMIVMDKRDKVTTEAFNQMLAEEELSTRQIDGIQDFLTQSSMDDLSEKLGECEGLTSLRKIMNILEECGLGEFLGFDVSIVRGLAYYTGTVFEVNTPQKNSRAICGGGRYDSLLSTYGGDKIPAAGFGFGDVVILDLLSDLGKLPDFSKQVDYLIVPFSTDQTTFSFTVGNHLRKSGKRVENDFSFKKMKKTLQKANDLNAEKVIFLFPDELASGQVVVRDMKTHQQNNLSIEELFSNPVI